MNRFRPLLLSLALAPPLAFAQAATPPAAPAPAAAAAPAAAPLPADIAEQIKRANVVPPLLALGQRFNAEANWPLYELTMKRVSELRPHAGNIRLELAAAYAMQDNKPAGYDTLLGLRDQGWGFAIESDDRLANLHGTEIWTFLVEGFKANRETQGSGSVAYTLPEGDLLIEALAWDPERKQLLAGSVRTGEISLVGDGGVLTPLVKPDATNGLWGVFEMAADPARDRLYVASAAIPHVKHAKGEDYGRAGVWTFELSSGKYVSRAVLPRDGLNRLITGLVVGPDGIVYAADGQARQIFKLDGDTLRPLLDNPRLSSIRGLALSGDGKRLYFSDYELGLFGVDLSTGRPFDVKVHKAVSLFGIESLYWHEGNLVAVQNGLRPTRIARLVLTPDGTGVTAAQPIDVAQRAFGQPTRGAIGGKLLYVIANSQKGGYTGLGVPRDASKLERIRIWRSPLDAAP
ncbi:MAG: hypothetical protein LW860_03760 [Xanthomonadaceae bacterium]|nr:hypothetical protein [Xanthomonadaceae bacterium]